MKVVAYFIRNTLAGWFANGGYQRALERMGHDVTVCAFPRNAVHDVDAVRENAPSLATLADCDVILSLYHEYTQPWLEAVYGFEAWQKLAPKVVARFDESMDRTDLDLPRRVPELLKWASHYSFPAVQDAKKYGGEWHSYGADCEMFFPIYQNEGKAYDVAFIGSLYQIRMEYLKRLAESVQGRMPFHCGSVGVQTLGGMRQPESTQLLAEEYRKIKVFFCLPPMSRLIVAKVFDVMACGTFVMYPRLPGELRENLSIFEDKKHIVYYEPGHFRENGKQIARWLADDSGRESIARLGCQLVREKYTLENMLTSIMSMARQEVAA